MHLTNDILSVSFESGFFPTSYTYHPTNDTVQGTSSGGDWFSTTTTAVSLVQSTTTKQLP
jgi:hypothetical protein